ncbi:hypothetical protein M405DRAFT_818247 [Rhizopogon salebrosus TDB-379]|nr:hypothetical protein M405DRAFT_818247 [Rhizopogon salebrosus TDB-379]
MVTPCRYPGPCRADDRVTIGVGVSETSVVLDSVYMGRIQKAYASYPLSNISFRFHLCGSCQSHESPVATAEFCVVCGSETPSCVYPRRARRECSRNQDHEARSCGLTTGDCLKYVFDEGEAEFAEMRSSQYQNVTWNRIDDLSVFETSTHL